MIHLREWRTHAGLTLKQVGDVVGRHHMTIYKWESGLLFPDVRALLALAEAYRTHPAALFFDPKHWPDSSANAASVMAAFSDRAPEPLMPGRTDPHLARQIAECTKALERMPREARDRAVALIVTVADITDLRRKKKTSVANR